MPNPSRRFHMKPSKLARHRDMMSRERMIQLAIKGLARCDVKF